MNEIRNAVIAVVVALVVSAGLAGFMYKGVQAVNIEKTLHVYDYPKTGRFLTSRDVNPAAAYALLRVQAMKTIPRNFNHLSMQTHTSDDRIFDLIRTVAIYRGGAAAMTCESSRSDVTACRLEAVLPADMAQDLGDLQDAGIPEYQRWIDRQPVRPTWRDKGVAEFTITNVEVLMLEAKTGAWRSDYGVILSAGIGALIVGGLISLIVVRLLWAIAVDLVKSAMRSRARRRGHDAKARK